MLELFFAKESPRKLAKLIWVQNIRSISRKHDHWQENCSFFVLHVGTHVAALCDRIMGLIFVSISGAPVNEYREWIDPGLSAAVGAASFFSGVSRLTISLTVTMGSMLNLQVFLWPRLSWTFTAAAKWTTSRVPRRVKHREINYWPGYF